MRSSRRVRTTVVLAVLTLAVTACGGGGKPGASATPSTPSPSGSLTAPVPSATPLPGATSRSPSAGAPATMVGPVWPIEPRTVAALPASAHPVAGVPVLKAIRTGRQGTYERLTLEFTASFGAATVRYVPVVHEDPSDKVVPLKGTAFLTVVVHNAVAGYAATPITPYAGPSTVTPGYPTLKQVSISGDFEAVLSFGVGLGRTAGFRVFRLRSPERLVVDVAEPPTWRYWPDNSLAAARTVQAALDQGHQPWRGDPASVAEVYARGVYGFSTPVVTRVGADRYRLAHKGSSDSVTVRAVRLFTGEGRSAVAEIADTR